MKLSIFYFRSVLKEKAKNENEEACRKRTQSNFKKLNKTITESQYRIGDNEKTECRILSIIYRLLLVVTAILVIGRVLD